ncbi:MAG: hypothetical protein KBG77_12045 [Dermatophilaceae bacterium]|nr:hypothetical protein [Dermatophilaceae bacterium]
MTPSPHDRLALALAGLLAEGARPPCADTLSIATNHLTFDADARAIYRRYQDERIGDPRGHGWRDWPELTGAAMPRNRAIRGWRFWGVDDIGLGRPRLLAPYRPEPTYAPARFHRGVNVASHEVCRARVPHHPSPEGFCRCGFRIVQSLTVLQAFILDQTHRFSTPLVVGEVLAWGRVCAFAPDDDWQWTARAERIRIAGPLYTTPEVHARWGHDLTDHYGAPCLPLG